MKTLMIQGTSSSVGKSLLVTGLCRLFARRGWNVAPFKAQNMSNNAAVCADGAEIGRAQFVQAAAAGIEPTADLNPVLLKPEADARSQVILAGRAWQTLPARGYYQHREQIWPVITAALERLRRQYELLIIEGAGSPVELNLRELDMVNMAIARHVGSPVLLVGDIDRGGVFAQLLGTLWLLPEEERRLVRGLIVNKFRGDPALFVDGVRILQEKSGLPVLGVVPFLKGLDIPEEDSVALETAPRPRQATAGEIDIAVVRLPHIANFDDFDPLRGEPGVQVRFVATAAELGRPHAVILPGTKSTCSDLDWLREHGLAEPIRMLAREGVAIVGICGGYQMLGRLIRDPDLVEARQPETPGLDLLPVATVFAAAKETCQADARLLEGPGWLGPLHDHAITGYEIHLGRTISPRPWLRLTARNGTATADTDGAVSADGRIWGCYLHGLFANDGFRQAWLGSLGRGTSLAAAVTTTQHFDRLADALAESLDPAALESIVAGS